MTRRYSERRAQEDHRGYMKSLYMLSVDDYIRKHLYENPKYQDPKKLNKYEFQCFSQARDDGIIHEIFKRIGTTNRFFVEFGVGKDGLENNTINLLLQDWSGAWIEGNQKSESRIKSCYQKEFDQNKLKLKISFINAENIETLFQQMNIPEQFDFLSIDIDGNDYWVWKAIEKYQPRVVCIEYNGTFSPDIQWVMSYNPDFVWNGTSYFGSSLKSFELLGAAKGYKLVGCNFMGNNAFFVKEECVKNHFQEPFTAENHYEPPRYYLNVKRAHPREWGEFERI